MKYFNYHAKAQNLIKAGHCTQAKMLEKYNNISPALVLYFNNHIPMPIRFYKFDEYIKLLKLYNVKIEQYETE